MDLCLWAQNHGVTADDAARDLGLSPAQVDRVYKDIEQKRRSTRYLHLKAQLIEPVPEVAE
jgi:NAD+ synthase